MIVLDTTVLAYAVGDEHPMRRPCRALLSRVDEGGVGATTTPDVIKEFALIRARRRGRADAVRYATLFATVLAPLIPVSDEALRDGLTIFARSESIGAFDAVLVAAAIEAGAQALVTADRALHEIDLIPCLSPDDPAVDALR